MLELLVWVWLAYKRLLSLCLLLKHSPVPGVFLIRETVRCVIPLEWWKIVHLVVLCGYRGRTLNNLGLTILLFDAALCELELVGKSQPLVTVGGIEPTKIPSLLNGISGGYWGTHGGCCDWALLTNVLGDS